MLLLNQKEFQKLNIILYNYFIDKKNNYRFIS